MIYNNKHKFHLDFVHNEFALANKQFYSKVWSHSNQYLSKLIMSDTRPAFQFNAIDVDITDDENFNR